MEEKIVSLLASKPLIVPRILFQNYKKINITEEELIILICLINIGEKIPYNPESISKELGMDKFKCMQMISSLEEKNIISIKVEPNAKNELEEYIYLDLMYQKLFNKIIDSNEPKENKEESKDIFTVFETELGRTLSGMECEIIKGWLNDNISPELLKEALKEAVYNDVKNLKYIDRIIYSWKEKGIKTKEDVMKNKINYRKSQKSKSPVFDYNWLEDE